MGTKQFEYIKPLTQYNTSHCSCNNCPAKLFLDKDEYICEGIGNKNSICCIVLPTYISVNKKLFNNFIRLLDEEYRKRYNIGLLETVYITPSIKCFCDANSYKINNKILEKCAIKTQSELYNTKFTKLILLGDAVDLSMYFNMHYIALGCPYDIFEKDNARETFFKLLFKRL